MSYLRQLSAQVSQIVFLANMTILRLITTVGARVSKNFNISMSSAHKYHKSCSQLNFPVYGLLQLYELKLQKSHISVSSVHKYHSTCS